VLKRRQSQASPPALDSERGQIMVLTAAVLTLVLVFSALAIDVGLWLHTRTKLQADADAMALAGAQELCAKAECDPDAVSLATEYAPLNDITNAEIMSVVVGVDCDGITNTNHDRITVRTRRTVSTFLANIVGVIDAEIDTCATARKAEVAGGTGIVPFGIEDECLGEGEFGEPYDLKYDSDPDSTFEGCDKFGGNFGLLSIDTSGAGSGCGDPPDSIEELKLKQAICFGANRFLCAQEATECTGMADDDTCAGDHADDDESCTEPGNTTSAIKEGIGYRMDNTSEDCDEWEEVTFPGGGLRPECNPWLNEASKRVIMIPVVDGLFEGSGGTKIIDILKFAVFFLEDFEEKDCKGSDCDIVGRFIVTSLSASYEGLTDLEEDSSLTVVTLIN
jgi:Flp pilus assembly protein TadG